MSFKASVIIPVYNAEDSIARCVNSLLCGSLKDLEIILIDDCSKDSSLKICRELEALNPNIKVLSNPQNSGVSHTRNEGLKIASGEYILFADSDDYSEPDFGSAMLAAAESSGSALSLCGYVNHDEVFNHSTDIFAPKAADYYQENFGDLLLGLYKERLLSQLWNKAFKADIIKKNSILFDTALSMGEDLRFVLDYIECAGADIALIPQPLYHYIRDNPSSLMSTFGAESIENPLADIKRLISLSSLSQEEKNAALNTEQEAVHQQYIYKIMHSNMPLKVRRKEIIKLNLKGGNRAFLKALLLVLKEKLL